MTTTQDNTVRVCFNCGAAVAPLVVFGEVVPASAAGDACCDSSVCRNHAALSDPASGDIERHNARVALGLVDGFYLGEPSAACEFDDRDDSVVEPRDFSRGPILPPAGPIV